MRLLIASLLLAAPAVAQAPTLAPAGLSVFKSGWSAGQWKVTPTGSPSSTRSCLQRVDDMVMPAGVDPAKCRLAVVANDADRAAFTYECPAGVTGRTDIRRDADGVFVVAAQGIVGGKPFDNRGEYRRTGDCPAATAARS